MSAQELNTQSVLSMKSDGYYSLRTRGAKLAIDNIYGLMEKAVRSLPDTSSLRFADFGAADGGTSAEMWSQLISGLRARGDMRPIEMLYTDLPSNDFSTLFKTMQGMGAETDHAYQKQHRQVYVHGCGTGFHEQLMPANSLDLGFSATAMHYVSEKPCQIEQHVHMVGATEAERQKFAAQAEKDWTRILLARASELVSGGRLVLMNFGIDEHGRYLGNTGGQNMFNRFTAHWRALVDDGTITEDEFRAASFAQHYRTVDEFTAPFDMQNSAVTNAGLKLISARTHHTPCPYRQHFETSDDITSQEFAAQLMPTMRSWSETVFSTALKGRTENERTQIINRFYGNYEAEIAADPTDHAMDYIHVIMEIEKQ